MTALKKLCLALLVGISCNVSFAEKSQPKFVRRLTLSSGYDDAGRNSNEGLKHLPLSGIQAYSWGFDVLGQLADTPIKRAAMLVGDFVLHTPFINEDMQGYWLLKEKWWPYLPAYHEFGHARAAKAFTKNSFSRYYFSINNDSVECRSVMCAYLQSLKHMAFNKEAITYFKVAAMENPVRDIAVFGGGLNNESRLTKEISDWVYRYNGHVTYFWPYLRGKLGVVTYAYKTVTDLVSEDTGDVGHILKYYTRDDKKFNLYSVVGGGVASILLSGSTYSFLNGFYTYIKTGNPVIEPLTYKGVRVPDINMYFTRNGLSFEVVSGYQVNPNWWVNLSAEWVMYPKAFHSAEFTPSMRYVLNTQQHGTFDFDIGVVINTFGYFSGFAGVEWTDPINPVTFGAKLIHHNANTYVGERNIPNALESNHDVELVVTASINY